MRYKYPVYCFSSSCPQASGKLESLGKNKRLTPNYSHFSLEIPTSSLIMLCGSSLEGQRATIFARELDHALKMQAFCLYLPLKLSTLCSVSQRSDLFYVYGITSKSVWLCTNKVHTLPSSYSFVNTEGTWKELSETIESWNLRKTIHFTLMSFSFFPFFSFFFFFGS